MIYAVGCVCWQRTSVMTLHTGFHWTLAVYPSSLNASLAAKVYNKIQTNAQLSECVPSIYVLWCLMFAPVRLSVAKNKGPLPYKQSTGHWHEA